MIRAAWLLACVVPLALLTLSSPAQQAEALTNITWKKTVLDKVPLRGRGRRRRQQGRQDGRPQRRVLVRGPGLEAARDAASQATTATAQNSLQPESSPAGPKTSTATATPTSSSSTSPASRATGSRTPRASRRPLEEARHLAQRLQRDAAVRRPVRHRQARPGHGLAAARARATKGQMAYFTPGKDPTQALGDAPDQRAEHAKAARPIPGTHAGSRTAWASATSTATAGST